MASKSVYGLFFESADRGLVIFYVGCTNDIARRNQEHNRNAFDAKSIEYDTYKYRLIRDLASAGIGFKLEVLTPAAEINDRCDEYSWILKFADYNRENGIEFYDGLPLTNMKAGDFLEEMLQDRKIRSADAIRTWRQARAESIRRVRYNRTSFGTQDLNRTRREEILAAVRLETVESKTTEVIKQLDRDRRNRERSELIAATWEERRRHWEATGEMWGIDYDIQTKGKAK